ncbi:MAG: relaxase/mobilization nuclease domain-containing protein [Oscillospiraceae bacterium]|nr:relaxase/mobilization nuclease domain-containing protein [Oscillospiraceae bacterium]
MASVKFVAVSRSLKGIIDYVEDREKTDERLITGVNCVAESALDEFESVKKEFHKTDGRAYYHIVQAFSPDDPLDFETAHEIGCKFAEYFEGYQALVVTHMNTAHIHNHIILNSVNYENGMKFHQSAQEMRQAKEFSNELCRQYGLSVTETKADPFRVPQWKEHLRRDIRSSMEQSNTREQFIARMEELGYGVKWEDGHKYITYTTPDNIRCRDSKLFDSTLTRESMELYFEMGGAAYLENRQETAALYGEDTPTLDDAVGGIAGAIDALLGGDGPRFHLETVHHSEDEIRLMLAMGQKLSRATVTVQDKDNVSGAQVAEAAMRAAAELSDLIMRQMISDAHVRAAAEAEEKEKQRQAEEQDRRQTEEQRQRMAEEEALRLRAEEEEQQRLAEEEEFEEYHGFGMSMSM